MVKKTIRHCGGFTLIEMLVTLAITGIVMSAVYAVYIASLQTAVSEEHRVDLQQNQRFAIDLLMSQLRHAGYDKAESLDPTVRAAGADYIYFTADYDDDGAVDDGGEHVVFCKYTDANGEKQLGFVNSDGDDDGDGTLDYLVGNAIDADNDGFADAGHGHGTTKTHQPVIAIEELEFYYGVSSGSPTVFPANPADVRSVQISLLARTEKSDRKYTPTGAETFVPASKEAAPATTTWKGYTDGHRRRLMIGEVKFRNMGL